MSKFESLTEDELLQVDGGAIEILIAGKLISGAAAVGVIGLGGLALVGVAYVGYRVATK